MKTLIKLLFLMAVISLVAGCNKDDELWDQNNDLILKNASIVPVFVVEPNGTDDTENLKNAFDDAKAAGPGSVVQLIEGEYHIGFIEIRDFCGTLKGAGKGKSIITAMNNLDLDPLLAKGLFPALVKFVGGEVTVCHLTIRTPAGRISVGGPGYGHVSALLCFTAFNPDYESLNESRSAKAMVDNICLKSQKVDDGGIGYVYKYNGYFGLLACADYISGANNTVPRQKVDITITNSEFDTFCYGIVIQALKNSKVEVGGKNRGNTFNNIDQGGGVWECRDIEFLATGNTFNVPPNSWGFDADDYPWYGYLKNENPEKPSLIFFSDNVFNLDQANYGMFFRNYRRKTNPEEMPVLFNAKNNQFTFKDGLSKGIVCNRTKDVVIRNNKFSGYGFIGVQANSPGDAYNENGLLIGNNFVNFEGVNSSVNLNSKTRNWTLVGGDLGETVINNGVNNIITGFNNQTSDEPLGQTIEDNLEEMRVHMIGLK